MQAKRGKWVKESAIGRKIAVAGVFIAFAIVIILATLLILSALNSVTRNANALDEQRSHETTAGALSTLLTQLSTTLNDYAAWDDAATHVYSLNDQSWITENYGDTTVNSDLFDTMALLDDDGRIILAYKDGEQIDLSLPSRFGPGVSEMIERVRDTPPEDVPEASGFVETADGIAAAGVALIRNKSSLTHDGSARRFLLFVRHLTDDKLRQLGETYVIKGLSLAETRSDPDHYVNILDPNGNILGKLTWHSMKPGDISLGEVRPQVLAAIALVGLIFLSLLIIGFVTMRRLTTDEAAARQELLIDRLSGLYNRSGLFMALESLMEKAHGENCEVKLICLDLDGFKEVNDSFGHQAGDLLIRAVAAALRVLVPQDALLARLGGDEFAIAFGGTDAQEEGRKLCDALTELFSEPFMLGDRVAGIGCSMGSAFSQGGEIDGAELFRQADMAMYEAKEAGRGRHMAYQPHMDTRREEKNQLEADLKHGLENGEITVVFQPVVNTLTRRISGVEALARWERPGYGPIRPDVFIAAAERSGLIDRLGMLVLERACEAAIHWPDIKLAVNISPMQFRNPAFARQVQDILERTGIQPKRVMLEMTEGYLINHPERAGDAIEKLKQLGLSIALDDFGSGFASIGYLRQFGFNRMKIDKSLVDALDEGGRSLETLTATVALARSLGIPVTAEGIETEDQAAIVQLCGCDELQGYLFARPLREDQVSAMLAQQEVRQTQKVS